VSLLRRVFARLSRDVGIDLGTANTLVHVQGRGIVLREPSIVAIDRDTLTVRWIGEQAKRLEGRTPPHIVVARPLKDGVIADFDITHRMLKYFIGKALGQRTFAFPRVVVGIPSGVTEVERRAVEDAAMAAGASEARTIDEPMAAAIGAGLPVHEPAGSMIVDIGGGTTEVAVISLGGIVATGSIRIAGDEIDEAIIAYTRRAYNLAIGQPTAERIKHAIGSAVSLSPELTTEVRGRNLITGLPTSIELNSTELREAISEPVLAIVEAVKSTLEQTPPELASDLMERGICLAGGGSLLRGIDQLISRETEMPVQRAADPLSCVALGTGRAVENWANYGLRRD